MSRSLLFTSESVTEGHPDKVADQISDAILDAALASDAHSRVACETLVKTGMVILAGEIRTKAHIDVQSVVRKVLQGIGYTHGEVGFDAQGCAILQALDRQSPDIAQGVDGSESHEQGAGDQGMMFGYACDETPELMPAPISLAHSIARRLAFVRKTNLVKGLRPDGKVQVTFRYVDGRPESVDTVLVSTQHDPDVQQDWLKQQVISEVVEPCLPSAYNKKAIRYLVNPTGRFVIGGPTGDAGLTGRKIIVDTYGGMGRHGGGAFSGKDASKVDRSAAYFARYIAKNIIAAKLARQCEVQLAYAIGRAEPVSIHVRTFGTHAVDETRIEQAVGKTFVAKPAAIIERLNLLRPGFLATAAYGHFGRNEDFFTWERTDAASDLARHAS